MHQSVAQPNIVPRRKAQVRAIFNDMNLGKGGAHSGGRPIVRGIIKHQDAQLLTRVVEVRQRAEAREGVGEAVVAEDDEQHTWPMRFCWLVQRTHYDLPANTAPPLGA